MYGMKSEKSKSGRGQYLTKIIISVKIEKVRLTAPKVGINKCMVRCYSKEILYHENNAYSFCSAFVIFVTGVFAQVCVRVCACCLFVYFFILNFIFSVQHQLPLFLTTQECLDIHAQTVQFC